VFHLEVQRNTLRDILGLPRDFGLLIPLF
jgi:hypothetical protein